MFSVHLEMQRNADNQRNLSVSSLKYCYYLLQYKDLHMICTIGDWFHSGMWAIQEPLFDLKLNNTMAIEEKIPPFSSVANTISSHYTWHLLYSHKRKSHHLSFSVCTLPPISYFKICFLVEMRKGNHEVFKCPIAYLSSHLLISWNSKLLYI